MKYFSRTVSMPVFGTIMRAEGCGDRENLPNNLLYIMKEIH